MSSKRNKSVVAVLMAAFAVVIGGLAPVQAGAATTTYPSGNQSDFATGNGGWSDSTEYGGLCVPAVTCPQLSGSFQSTGGAAGSGDGYIRTDSGPLTVASLLSTSTHTWTSPAFTYNGVGGKEPENLRFSLGVNPQVTELLNLGADVEISARAIAVSGGGSQVLIDARSPGTTPGWKTLNSQIGPAAMEVGKSYRIEISLSIGGLAAVLPGGSVGFDDVSLRAAENTSGNNGNNGNNGNGAALPPPKVIPPGVAYLYRNKLYIRVKCPRAFKPRCRISLAALTRKRGGKRLTPIRRANLRWGGTGRKVLGVKRPFRIKVRKMAKARKRVLVKQWIRSKRGKKRAIRYQHLRVVIRARK